MRFHLSAAFSFLIVIANCLTFCANQRNTSAHSITFEDIVVPSSFSPNNDGINDSWEIVNVNKTANVFVYTIYGELVYRCIGNYTPWNGVYAGKKVLSGKYYYIIDIGKGLRNPNGWIVLMR